MDNRNSSTSKPYLKCSAKEKRFDNGGAVVNIGVRLEELLSFAEAVAVPNAHGERWVNLVVSPRKTLGNYGDTHSVYARTERRHGDD